MSSTEISSDRARPHVALPNSRRGPLLAMSMIAIMAAGLFATLEFRRAALPPSGPDAGPIWGTPAISSPSELVVPAAPRVPDPLEDMAPPDVSRFDEGRAGRRILPNPPSQIADRPSRPDARRPSEAAYPQRYSEAYPTPTYPQAESGKEVEAARPRLQERRAIAEGEGSGDRVQAVMLANPSTTVPKGAMIHAVLETAISSSWGGPARAIISRDVRGFDGTRILIPRGSRLYGEYKSELAPGQGRLLVQWQRLTRPDGAIIALDSPSADPLGRIGIEGSVNSHFFERFGGAILQSILDIGIARASRNSLPGPIIVGLPGGASPQAGRGSASDAQRTIKIKQGAQVSVFVARDLDFVLVER